MGAEEGAEPLGDSVAASGSGHPPRCSWALAPGRPRSRAPATLLGPVAQPDPGAHGSPWTSQEMLAGESDRKAHRAGSGSSFQGRASSFAPECRMHPARRDGGGCEVGVRSGWSVRGSGPRSEEVALRFPSLFSALGLSPGSALRALQEGT